MGSWVAWPNKEIGGKYLGRWVVGWVDLKRRRGLAGGIWVGGCLRDFGLLDW